MYSHLIISILWNISKFLILLKIIYWNDYTSQNSKNYTMFDLVKIQIINCIKQYINLKGTCASIEKELFV